MPCLLAPLGVVCLPTLALALAPALADPHKYRAQKKAKRDDGGDSGYRVASGLRASCLRRISTPQNDGMYLYLPDMDDSVSVLSVRLLIEATV